MKGQIIKRAGYKTQEAVPISYRVVILCIVMVPFFA